MNEKIHFDIYKSRSLSLRIELSEIQRKLGELQHKAILCEAKLGYYDIQMIRCLDIGYTADEPIDKIEKVAS